MHKGHLMWIVLVVLAAGISAFFLFSTSNVNPSNETATSTPPLPPLDMTAQLKKSKGFQAVISYTNHGFEPTMTTIKKGNTVRFSNNSEGNLLVTTYGPTPYPKAKDSCGASALDSCAVIAPGGFWEFTFNVQGKWGFQNKIVKHKGDAGSSGFVAVK